MTLNTPLDVEFHALQVCVICFERIDFENPEKFEKQRSNVTY